MKKRIRIEGFPERLKSLIDASGMTQKEFAKRARIFDSAVSHYIKGNRFPNKQALFCMASVLHISEDELIGKKEGVNRMQADALFKDAIDSINALNDAIAQTDCPAAMKMCETAKILLRKTRETLFWECWQMLSVSDKNDKQ